MVYFIGIVVALHGKETSAGEFLVLDILDANLPPQIELPLKSSTICTSLPFLFLFLFAVTISMAYLFISWAHSYI